ncbi:AMP-binding protein [Novosphingobium rosa]|uniref:AMP-binding protein n=1 Tax=Novosphingobium rosa TaxID=76978 RepID=UPI000835E2FB|nr:AMP-binding protein [Novosphingobium rosa]
MTLSLEAARPKPAFAAGQRDTVVELLGRAAARTPDRTFAIIDGTPFTYRQVDEASNAMAREIATLGVHKGECVVTLFDTTIDSLICWFAINKLGAIWVPVNTAYRGEFLRGQVHDTGAKLVMCEAHYLERFMQIAEGLPQVQLILTRGSQAAIASIIPVKPLDSFRGTNSAPLPLVVQPADLAALLYTSGTTGPSKGCMITHNYFAAVGRINRRHTLLDEGETLWTCLPLFHAAALCGVLSVMGDGSCVAVSSQFSVRRFWDEIEQSGAVSAMLMASIFALVAQAPDCEAAKRYRGRLKMVFGVPISPEVRKIWHERFGAQIVSSWSYGQTEGIRMTAVPLDETPPELCAGRVVDEYEMMIFDDHDQPVPEGTVGQIVFRPREANVMFEGYWKRPDATAAVWKNLWMHTGDLGKIVDGYLYFADRAKDYLRSRGENISSFEVERTFQAHHAVAEVAVHAVGAQTGEDEIKVTVVLRDDVLMTEEELCLWSIDNLPHFAVPRYVEFRAALPKNPTGRVLKYQLRDESVTPTTWDREAAGIQVRRRK